ADESALAPAHDLAADPDGTRQLAEVIIVIEECVEIFGAGRLCSLLAVAVADVLEQAALVFEFEVIPVLAAAEGAAAAVAQFQIMHALEDLREGLTLLEVQPTVITRLRITGPTVVYANQIHIPIFHGPTGTDRHR